MSISVSSSPPRSSSSSSSSLSTDASSLSSLAGLQFPVGQVSRALKQQRDDDLQRIGGGASIYVAAVLEYLTTQILTQAGETAKRHKHQHETDDNKEERKEEGQGQEKKEEQEAASTSSSTISSIASSDVIPPPTITPFHLARVFAEDDQLHKVIADLHPQTTEEQQEDQQQPEAKATSATIISSTVVSVKVEQGSTLHAAAPHQAETTPNTVPGAFTCAPPPRRSRRAAGWAGGKAGNTVSRYTSIKRSAKQAHPAEVGTQTLRPYK